MTNEEAIIKSALKYLVKMQIEEGSVGFAVDNDHDHDCCWDDVLAWLEAQPCEDAVSRSEAIDKLTKFYNMVLDDNGTKLNIRDIVGTLERLPSVTPQIEPCEDCISREEMLSLQTEYAEKMGATTFWKLRDDIRKLPSVTPSYNSVKTELKPCEDCISRQAVIDLTWDWESFTNITRRDGLSALKEMRTKIEDLPSVKPKYTDEEIDKAQAVEQAYVDKMVELAVKEIKRPKGKWISVTERLPENTEDVLAFDGEDYFVAWYEAQNIEMQGWHSWDRSFDRYYSIKAWMPIEPYTEVEDV